MKDDKKPAFTDEGYRNVGLDWLTAVVHLNHDGAIANSRMVPLLMERIRHEFPITASFIFADGELPEAAHGRRPYAMSLAPRQSILILFHPARSDVVIEVAGQAMEAARSCGAEVGILAELQPYLSRLDFAVDIPTDCNPTAFVEAGYSDRIKSVGLFKSSTGETVYVGSRSSENFARVYRYSSPHPRSHLLRVETVFRRNRARQVAERVLRDGHLKAAVATASSCFGWLHPLWIPGDAERVKFHRLSADASSDGKIRWIEQQVIPTLRLLAREGKISKEQLLEMVFGP